MATYDGTQVVLSIFDDINDDFTQKIVFDGYDESYELLLLFSYQHENSPSTYIIGISSHKNTVFCWEFLYDEGMDSFYYLFMF